VLGGAGLDEEVEFFGMDGTDAHGGPPAATR
jgi:hypothetical protein